MRLTLEQFRYLLFASLLEKSFDKRDNGIGIRLIPKKNTPIDIPKNLVPPTNIIRELNENINKKIEELYNNLYNEQRERCD